MLHCININKDCIYTGISRTKFTLINTCGYTVWLDILGNTQLDSTGFELPLDSREELDAHHTPIHANLLAKSVTMAPTKLNAVAKVQVP
ncbi:hypothetical protein CXB51_005613 [Gossypium anomalum]|uniref:Uncharacterized protein n=1 Tax=Gossypium anomalum TaxID=47600 RepID=A0A8J5ZFW3_9ROSI|nr:hypothetical protein CXB51_005613 [Gossypium anomalum]